MSVGPRSIVTRHLLIVGDPALSRGLMNMVLSRLGYVVTWVATAKETAAAISHGRFALALIALHLPDLPGLTLARRIRDSTSSPTVMPIIVFGEAWDHERIADRCRDAGVAYYLPKPISIARLVTSIHDHIHRPQRGSGGIAVMAPAHPFELERLHGFTDGDPQLGRELTTLYFSTAELYLDEMREALDGSGPGAWSRAAHALKGASANIGAAMVARLAGEAEHAKPSTELLRGLQDAIAAARDFLAKQLGDYPTEVTPRRLGTA